CNYNSDSVGGIVGGVSNLKGELLISNCHNNGHITVNVDYGGRIGGIIGSTYNSYIYPSNPITISGCINTGNISCNKVEYLGGILGYGLARPNITVSDCENRGAITVSQFSAYVGGVIGFGMTIRDCHNYGDIQVSGEAMMVGGLGGIVAAMISNCHNEGSLSATGQIGGIGGIAAGLGNIAADTMQTTINGSCLSSYNKGSITLTLNNSATARVGGVIGNLSPGVVAYCYNQGNLNCQMSYGRIGGVVGSFSLGSGLSNCYNTGRIDGANNVENLLFIGGIVGSGWATSTANNYWKDFADDVAFTGAGLWGFNSQDPNTTYPLDTGSSIFSATHWPSASDGWNLGTGAGSGYWQSLGSWNNGDPAYPKLWFE
ncbi:hypothetical protein, partial [uncultured Flavobacterium sp.]|uniref:hypothetical protein n=1 Tax=uncultured Flavobacterium sp. TaxID=165435 RepID=UPI0025CE2B6B